MICIRAGVAPRPSLLAFAALIAIAGDARAGEDPARTGPEWTRDAAAGYKLSTEDDRGTPLTLLAEPALRWTNPERSTDDGASFLWVADGRPMAFACVYRFRRNGAVIEDHEFHSLAAGPLLARREGSIAWAPAAPGIDLRPIPDAPRPAAGAAERLRQMRSLAREFRGVLETEKDRTELRLLPKPLHRNEGDGPDGALFAFVQATDPEILLLIQAADDGKGPAWHFAAARMSICILKVQYQSRDVWQVPWGTDEVVENPRNPYFVRRDVGRTGR